MRNIVKLGSEKRELKRQAEGLRPKKDRRKRNLPAKSLKPSVLLLILFCILFFAVVSFTEEKGGIKTVAVIAGDENMGRLKQPSGLFFDEVKKRLYVADSGNGRLISFDSDFKYLAELTNEAIALPTSLVKDKEGHFFVVDSGKGDIVFIDLEKKLVKPFPLSGVPSAHEQFVPGRMAIDQDNRLYIIDKLNKRIIVAEPTGGFVREITVKDKGLSGFIDVRVDDNGEIYALDTIGRQVYVFDEKGNVISRFSGRDNKNNFRFPISLAVDKNGLIYVVDQHAGKILVFDRKGIFQYAISRPGVKEGELADPSYIFIDKEGRIYTIDSNRIQVFQEEKR